MSFPAQALASDAGALDACGGLQSGIAGCRRAFVVERHSHPLGCRRECGFRYSF